VVPRTNVPLTSRDQTALMFPIIYNLGSEAIIASRRGRGSHARSSESRQETGREPRCTRAALVACDDKGDPATSSHVYSTEGAVRRLECVTSECPPRFWDVAGLLCTRHLWCHKLAIQHHTHGDYDGDDPPSDGSRWGRQSFTVSPVEQATG
jgi:hypothetical protein